jgi:hypothetical protein
MPTTSESQPCLCGTPGCVSLTGLFAPGHDQRYRGQCLNRICGGDPSGADDMEQFIPGHAEHYDMDCLRAHVGQSRKVLSRCFRGLRGAGGISFQVGHVSVCRLNVH